MRRREFIALLGGTAVVWPLNARAQQPALPVIGFLGAASPEGYAPFVGGFLRGLKEAGFVDGENIAIAYRWAEGQYDRLPALAADLVARRVSVMVATGGLSSSLAARDATKTIPIVFTLGSDPIKFGLVASLNRPGGNVTGVSLFAYLLDAKRVELMHELVPGAATIALLANSNNPQTDAQFADVEAASRTFRQQAVILKASSDSEIEEAFAALAQRRVSALLVSADPFFLSRRHQIVAAVARHAIPAMYEWRQFAEADGLMSYGVDLVDAYRQAGVYVAKILNGAKPADLPILQPTKFEFVINLRTAKKMGLDLPAKLLALADDVIE
jgi:putative tryptophan/tyrosine transport system substrate-binding protein